jgi:hypothetical protein
VDRVVGEISEEYAAERQRVLRSSIRRRVQLVRDVLGATSIASVELGYRLDKSISRSSPPARPPTHPCATWRAEGIPDRADS